MPSKLLVVSLLIFALALVQAPAWAQDDGSASLTVYLKWVGESGEERDVRISLDCEDGQKYPDRFINENSPNGWDLANIGPEGLLCNVREEVRDSYRPDIIDCQGLYIVPGVREECTLLNTKVVKRIEMFNRYGVLVMIVLILCVGLVSIRRSV